MNRRQDEEFRAHIYEVAGVSKNGSGPEEDALDIPEPLPKARPFPVEVMPRACQRLIEEAVACMSCAPDLVALPMLATLSSGIGASRIVERKRGWREGATLFTAVVASPGSMKSPAAEVARKPVADRQERYKREYREAKLEYDRERRQWEADKRESLKSSEAAPPEPEAPHMQRCEASDTTVEALVGILEHNPRGLIVFRDELSGWVKGMDQYKTGGKGADRDQWLSIWSNSEVIVDRKSQNGEPIMLARPFVNVFGGIQPDRLSDLSGAVRDGMMDRFLFAYPETGEARDTDHEISERAEGDYRALYDAVADLTMPTDEYGTPNPKPLRMTDEAKQVFTEVVNGLAEETSRPGFPSYLEGAYSKMRGYLLRLSLVLSVCRHAEDVVRSEDERIEVGDVVRAVALLEYFKSHVRRVYGAIRPGATREESFAEELIEFVKENGENVVGDVGVVGKEAKSPTTPTTPTTNSEVFGWEGPAGQLFDSLKDREAKGLPTRSNELSQMVMKLAAVSPSLEVERGWRGKEKVLRIKYRIPKRE